MQLYKCRTVLLAAGRRAVFLCDRGFELASPIINTEFVEAAGRPVSRLESPIANAGEATNFLNEGFTGLYEQSRISEPASASILMGQLQPGAISWPLLTGLWANGVKLSGGGHPPEHDLGHGCQAGGFAGLAGLVPAPWALGLAFVAAPGTGRDEVAVPGDLGGQVGGEFVKERRGKSIRSR